jgi:hypothetical protein
MSRVKCPHCYSIYRFHPDHCSCGFPINGSDLEQYRFMSRHGRNPAKVSRRITQVFPLKVLVLGIGLNLLISLMMFFSCHREASFHEQATSAVHVYGNADASDTNRVGGK